MRRDYADQKPMLSKYAMESEMEKLTNCHNPLCENVLCRCVDGFSSKAERDSFLIAEAKYSVRSDFRRLQDMLGDQEARSFLASLSVQPF